MNAVKDKLFYNRIEFDEFEGLHQSGVPTIAFRFERDEMPERQKNPFRMALQYSPCSELTAILKLVSILSTQAS